MNVRYNPIQVLFLLTISFISGCIKDDLSSCGSNEVDIYVYSKTRCQTDTVYPEDINKLLFCLFDDNEILVDYVYTTDIHLDNHYCYRMKINSGEYRVVAWAGIQEQYFDVTQLRIGETRKRDVLFHLRRSGDEAYSIEGLRVYQGESPRVYITENHTDDVRVDTTSVNMLEVTNRITVSLNGVSDLDEFQVIIESDNGSMNINGSIANDEMLEYEADYEREGTILTAYFTMLELDTEHSNTLIIKDTAENTEIFRGDLLATLLLKNPDIDLACDHDFVISFEVENRGDTYAIAKIWVNNWLVHSYDTEM